MCHCKYYRVEPKIGFVFSPIQIFDGFDRVTSGYMIYKFFVSFFFLSAGEMGFLAHEIVIKSYMKLQNCVKRRNQMQCVL